MEMPDEYDGETLISINCFLSGIAGQADEIQSLQTNLERATCTLSSVLADINCVVTLHCGTLPHSKVGGNSFSNPKSQGDPLSSATTAFGAQTLDAYEKKGNGPKNRQIE